MPSWRSCAATQIWPIAWRNCRGARLFAVETGGGNGYADARYQAGDAFLFGPETRGLPAELLAAQSPERRISIPMRPGNRSLNLGNAGRGRGVRGPGGRTASRCRPAVGERCGE
jgi:tRNA (cytidine/uridine-2'-O-)-methyltransferase